MAAAHLLSIEPASQRRHLLHIPSAASLHQAAVCFNPSPTTPMLPSFYPPPSPPSYPLIHPSDPVLLSDPCVYHPAPASRPIHNSLVVPPQPTHYYEHPSLPPIPNHPLLLHPAPDVLPPRYPIDTAPPPQSDFLHHHALHHHPPSYSSSAAAAASPSSSIPHSVSALKPPKHPAHVPPYPDPTLAPIHHPAVSSQLPPPPSSPPSYLPPPPPYPSDPPSLPHPILPHLPPQSIPPIRPLSDTPSNHPHPHIQPSYSPLPSPEPSPYQHPAPSTPQHHLIFPQQHPLQHPHSVHDPHNTVEPTLSDPTPVQPLLNAPLPFTPSPTVQQQQQPKHDLLLNIFQPPLDPAAPHPAQTPPLTLQPVLTPQQHIVPLTNPITVPDVVPHHHPHIHTHIQISVEMLDSFLSVGRVCRAIGRYDLAADAYRACIAICPDSSEARISYASCWNSVDISRPEYVHLESSSAMPEEVFNDIGNILRSLGRASEAEMAFRAALNIAPRNAHAWNNLGNAMRGRGAIFDAMQCYSASLSYHPGFAAAHCNLAGLLRDQGKPQDAEAQYRAALMSDPNLAEAAAGLGTALRDMGRTEEAVAFYVRAVTLQANAADHHANLANTYKDLNRIEESIVSYQNALALQPDMPDAFCNMVHSLSVICDWSNRSQNFVTLLAIIDKQLDTLLRHPNTPTRLFNTLMGALSNSTPQLVDVGASSRSDRDSVSVSSSRKEENSNDVGRRRYVHHPSSPSVVKKAKSKAKFSQFMTNTSSVVAPVLTTGLPSVQPFHALIYPMSPEKFRALSAAYAARAESMVQGIPHVTQRWTAPRGGQRARLKVGYVSSDYNNHPYSHLTQSIYGLHATGMTVECFCYALTPSDQSAWRLRIERESENFRDISGMTAKQSAEAIANDGIHVLVNCNGYTKGARTELFALRPAPVQVSFMGFPGTLGAHFIEYFITDVVTSPPRLANRMHSEALLYHPHSYFVNDHRQTSIPGPGAYPSGPLTRAHYGLPDDCFLFIMHNQLYKLSPDTFDVWARILKRVPGSKIWLLRFPPAGEQRIRQEAVARGLTADRLIFTDVAGKEEHVARAGLGDLFLDTPTCNAHTTGTDVLWSGCPMITCPGSLFASRVAASILTAAGVPELVAADMNEYEDLAVELATNRGKLAQIRAKIESSRMTNALFDTERWVRNVEGLYWRAWKNFEEGNEPRHIYGQDVYDGSTMVGGNGSTLFGGSVAGGTESWHSETPLHGRMYSSTVMT